MIGTIETLKYGTNQIGTPYRDRDGGGWFRVDTYTSFTEKRPVNERRFAAGKDDVSSVARDYPHGEGNIRYHPKCSCCWLGFSHTVDLHNRCAVGSWD